MILIITKRKLDEASYKNLKIELLWQINETFLYALVHKDCEVEDKYSVICLINHFISELMNERVDEYLYSIISEQEPIIVIATPIPFPIGYIPGRYYEITPYAIFLCKNPIYTPEIISLVARFISEHYCSMLSIDHDLGWLIFTHSLLFKSTEVSDYSQLFRDCLDNILSKMSVKEIYGGILLKQRDTHTYIQYLRGILKDLESSEESY